MNKAELIAAIANLAMITKVDAAKAVDAVADVVVKELSKGNKVTWTGFGTFEVRSRKERMGRNPKTGTPMKIQATKTPAFKAGKGLKDAVKK